MKTYLPLFTIITFFISTFSHAQFKPIKRDLKQLRLINHSFKNAISEKSVIYNLALAGVKSKDLKLIIKDLKEIKKFPKISLLSNQVIADRKYSGVQFFITPQPIISFKGKIFKYDLKKSFYINYSLLKDQISKEFSLKRGLAEEDKNWREQRYGLTTISAVVTGAAYTAAKNKLKKTSKKITDNLATIEETLSIAEKFAPLCIHCSQKDISSKTVNGQTEDHYQGKRLDMLKKNLAKSLKCSSEYMSFTTNYNHFSLVTKEPIKVKDNDSPLNLNFELPHQQVGLKEIPEADQIKLYELVTDEQKKQSSPYTVTVFNKNMDLTKTSDKKKQLLRDLASVCSSNMSREAIIKTYSNSVDEFKQAYREQLKIDQGEK